MLLYATEDLPKNAPSQECSSLISSLGHFFSLHGGICTKNAEFSSSPKPPKMRAIMTLKKQAACAVSFLGKGNRYRLFAKKYE